MEDFRGKIITQDGLIACKAELEARKLKLRQDKRDCPDMTTRACGNTAGGHAMRDENLRQHDLQESRIERLSRLCAQATIAPTPTSCSVLRIGLVGTFRYRKGHGGKKREYQQLHIVGFEEGNCDSLPRKACYETPLPQAFLGQPCYMEEDVFFDGRLRTVTLISIAFPLNIEPG